MIDSFLKILTDLDIVEPDLLERYLLAACYIRRCTKKTDPRVLDVGGKFFTSRQRTLFPMKHLFPGTVALDIARLRNSTPHIRGDGRRLPFKSNSFDAVVAMDVLEHLPEQDRLEFILELGRVSANTVLLSFPEKNALNVKVDRLAFDYVKKYRGVEFTELQEHLSHSLPEADSLLEELKKMDAFGSMWRFSAGSLLNYQIYFYLRNHFYYLRNRESLEIMEKLLLHHLYLPNSRTGPFYRSFMVLSKTTGEKQDEPDAVFQNVQQDLQKLRPEPLSWTDTEKMIRSIQYLLNPGAGISVFVVCEPGFSRKNVKRSLEHLVTQKLAEQKYRVFLILKENRETEYFSAAFPQVTILENCKDNGITLFQKALALTDSEYFYFVSENNLTFTDSVARLYGKLEDSGLDFITFSFRDSKDDEILTETDELFLANIFIRRRVLADVSGFDSHSRRLTLTRNICGWEVTDYKQYFSLFSDLKKIVFATHLFFPAVGGAENLAGDWTKTVSSRYQTEVVTSCAYSTEAFFLKDSRRIEKSSENLGSVTVRRCRFSRTLRRTLNVLAAAAGRMRLPGGDRIKLLRFGPRSRDYFNCLIDAAPDMIVATPFPMLNCEYAFLAARKLNVPLITIPCFHIHDRFSFFNELLIRILRHSDAVIALTGFERDFFVSELGIDGKKVFVIPPALDFADSARDYDRTKIKEHYRIKEKDVVLCLGQHGRHKNIAALVRAMPLVWKKQPDTALVIAGGTTAYTKELKDIVKEMAEQKKVYFIDNFKSSRKDEIFNMADIFVCLSEYESFGIVFIEAMKNGLPVIGSINSVVRSIVRRFENGLLVNPANTAEISGALIELLQDRNIMEHYSIRSRFIAKKEYNQQEIRQKMMGVIEYVANRRNRDIL